MHRASTCAKHSSVYKCARTIANIRHDVHSFDARQTSNSRSKTVQLTSRCDEFRFDLPFIPRRAAFNTVVDGRLGRAWKFSLYDDTRQNAAQ